MNSNGALYLNGVHGEGAVVRNQEESKLCSIGLMLTDWDIFALILARWLATLIRGAARTLYHMSQAGCLATTQRPCRGCLRCGSKL